MGENLHFSIVVVGLDKFRWEESLGRLALLIDDDDDDALQPLSW